jgi:hypothetical protein
MTISASEYAAMAYASYGFIQGEDALTKLVSFDPRLDKSAYRVLESKNEYTVFTKTATGEVVCAIKGVSQASDVASAALISVGALDSDPRMMELINVVRRYKRSGVGITVTGHSLGGALATSLANNEDVLGVTFNTGSFLAESTTASKVHSVARNEQTQNVIQFNTGTDPLSISSAGINPRGKSGLYYVSAKQLNSHSMVNFKGMEDARYQTDIDTRASKAQLYRSEHPNEKMQDFTSDDQLMRNAKNLKKLVDTYEEIKNWYELTKTLVKNRDQIPANLLKKWNGFKGDVEAVYRSLNRLNRARADGGMQGIEDAGRELVENGVRLTRHGTFEQFIREMGADNIGVEGSLGDAVRVAESRDASLDPEFDGYDEMEVYDVNDGLEPLDDGQGLGFDEDVAGADSFEAGVGVDEGAAVVDDGVALLGEGVEAGGLEVAGLAAAEAETLSVSMVSATALGVAGGVVGVAFTLYSIINAAKMSDDRVRKLAEIEGTISRTVKTYDSRFKRLCQKVGFLIPKKPDAAVGKLQWNMFYTEKVSFPWNNYDLYGNTIFTYLEYRANHPEVMYPGGGELVRLGQLHMKYFSPGVPFCLPRGGVGREMTVTDNVYGGELQEMAKSNMSELGSHWRVDKHESTVEHALDIHRGDWGEGDFLAIFSAFSEYRSKRNKASFKAEIDSFISAHTEHAFADMSKQFQGRWLDSLVDALAPGVKQYVEKVFDSVAYVESLLTTAFTLPHTRQDLISAVKALRVYVVSLVTVHRNSANIRLIEFEKDHGMAVFFRGLEELTHVHGMDRWVYNRGHDLSHYETIFGVGAVRILQDPPRSIAEWASANKLTEAQISRDNLDMVAFDAAGQKGQGDGETSGEFWSRFQEWQRATAKDARLHAMDPSGPVSHNVYTVSRGPDVGDQYATQVNKHVPDIVDVNAVTCAYVPRSKRKVSVLAGGVV